MKSHPCFSLPEIDYYWGGVRERFKLNEGWSFDIILGDILIQQLWENFYYQKVPRKLCNLSKLVPRGLISQSRMWWGESSGKANAGFRSLPLSPAQLGNRPEERQSESRD